jgi:hypothetical protein
MVYPTYLSRRSTVAAVLAALGCVSVIAAADPDDRLGATLQSAALHVARVEAALVAVIAEERYTQRTYGPAGRTDTALMPRAGSGLPAAPGVLVEGKPEVLSERKLVSDFIFVTPAGSTGVVGFRSIVLVDGKRVDDRLDRLRDLLSTPSGGRVDMAKLFRESSRFNIGNLVRDFNLPTVALMFLRQENQGRFTFSLVRTRRERRQDLYEVDFQETATPTFIRFKRSPEDPGSDLFVHGTYWIRVSDAAVVHTKLQVPGTSPGIIEVWYDFNEMLHTWLPSKMTEKYQPRDAQAAGWLEGAAEYSRYLRVSVETEWTIPPGP